MAKKSANPADAFRKAQRAKELKKNKEERKKVRENQTIRKDTRELESEIRELKGRTDASAKSRLADLEGELSYINKTKEKYVSEHPEARDRVFRTHTNQKDDQGGGGEGPSRSRLGPNGEDLSHLYDENGRLRDPKRSVYYHETYNPFGVPPPGMPYRERTPEEDSEDEDDEEEDEEDSDDDIVMPQGRPPAESEDDSDDSDDSDDIPLPEGPPPPKPNSTTTQPPLPPPIHMPPMPMSMPYGQNYPGQPFLPPQTRPFFRPPGMGMGGLPVRPNVQNVPFDQVYGTGPAGGGPSTFRPRPPPPPRGPNVPHSRPPAAVQDPLSDVPTQTYQGHRMAKHDLPARPPPQTGAAPGAGATTVPSEPTKVSPGPGPGPLQGGSGTISAAPVMRDLRKEATAFVPRGLKKKLNPGGVRVRTINSAPGAGEIDEDGDERKNVGAQSNTIGMGGAGGSGLMGKLQGVLSGPVQPSAPAPASGPKREQGGEDDYQKFLDGLGDIA